MKKLLLTLLFCLIGLFQTVNAQQLPSISIQHIGTIWAGQGYVSEQFLFECEDQTEYRAVTITIGAVNKKGKVIAKTEMQPFNIGGSDSTRYAQSFAEFLYPDDEVSYFKIIRATYKTQGRTMNLPARAFEPSQFKPLPIKTK